ncbi:hypothetical protein C7271_18555, partial [filamentous cyanobacterium CCP5]
DISSDFLDARAFADSFSNAQSGRGFIRVVGGQGGNITAEAGQNLSLGTVRSDARGSARSLWSTGFTNGGDGGDIQLSAGENLTVGPLASAAFTFVFAGQATGGNGGRVNLTAGNSVVTGSISSDSQSSSHSGDHVIGGNGGPVTVKAGQDITTGNVSSLSNAVSLWLTERPTGLGRSVGGDGGQISFRAGRDITTARIESLSTATSNTFDVRGGNGADITLTAGRDLGFDDLTTLAYGRSEPVFSTDPRLPFIVVTSGTGGDVRLTAQRGSIAARPTAAAPTQATIVTSSIAEKGSAGRAGEATLRVGSGIREVEVLTLSSSDQSGAIQIEGLLDLSLDNVDIITSKQVEVNLEFFAGPIIIPVGGQGQSGNVNVTSQGRLGLNNSTFLSDTNGVDPAGDVTLFSPGQISFNNSSINSSTNNLGQAGGIAIASNQGVTLTGERSQILARTDAAGQAGNILVETPQLTLEQGAQISTSTSGAGTAGDIKLTIADTLEVDGSAIASSTQVGSTGNGGNIDIDPVLTFIHNGGRIAVSSAGQGQGGNITLTSDRLVLDRGNIVADTLSSDGGNLTLNLRDLILLRNFSLISTSAGTAQAAGDGGNTTINLPQGFIVGTLGADSDIIAQAFEGRGGSINITAQGIFGLVERPAIRGNGTNDMDASSQLGESGTISINDPTVDPSRASVELPGEVVDGAGLIDRSCQADAGQGQSSLVVTGRGGVPPTPAEIVRHETESLADLGGQPPTGNAAPQPEASPVIPATAVVEAQTWHRDNSNRIILSAQTAAARVPAGGTASQGCPG